MAAPKAKTLIERFGFKDPELTTPAHDEMFIVCMGSVQRIIDLVVESDGRFECWRRMKQELNDHELVYLPSIYPELGYTKKDVFESLKAFAYVSDQTVPEKPIVAKNNFIIGFIDLFIRAKVISDVENGHNPVYKEEYTNLNLGYGHYKEVIKSRFSLNDVYNRDLEAIEHLLTGFNILIEIKPSIRSVGELIRQIQTYRQFSRENTVYVVISKTTAFKDILAQSNIVLLNYADVLPDSTRQRTL